MEGLGVPLKWRSVVLALYKGSSSRVLVSGHRGPSIPLRRSVGQGCPLAPYLYLFITEAFSFFFNRSDALLISCCDPYSIFDTSKGKKDGSLEYLKVANCCSLYFGKKIKNKKCCSLSRTLA